MKTLTAPFLLAVSALMGGGCAGPGPAAITNGRGVYLDVINRTDDEQLLAIVVRKRYDETFGMLAVSSVTASMKLGGSIGANAGVGSANSYEGNLVPLSAGVVYEENPTVSYTPMRGEKFIERMLAPVSAEQALLLCRMSTAEVEVLRLIIRRVNGLANPLYSSLPASEGFGRFVTLYTRLRERGKLDFVRSERGEYELLLHDYTAEDAVEVGELLRTLGVDRGAAGGPVAVPVRFFVGSPEKRGVDLETPSALEVIEAAAGGVEVPEEHLADGLARPLRSSGSAGLFTVHSSASRPLHAAVAVQHKGWWYFVDARDTASKQGFAILRTLVGMRLDDAHQGQPAPVLTVPVGG